MCVIITYTVGVRRDCINSIHAKLSDLKCELFLLFFPLELSVVVNLFFSFCNGSSRSACAVIRTDSFEYSVENKKSLILSISVKWMMKNGQKSLGHYYQCAADNGYRILFCPFSFHATNFNSQHSFSHLCRQQFNEIEMNTATKKREEKKKNL